MADCGKNFEKYDDHLIKFEAARNNVGSTLAIDIVYQRPPPLPNCTRRQSILFLVIKT